MLVGAKTKKSNLRMWEEQYLDPTNSYITGKMNHFTA